MINEVDSALLEKIADMKPGEVKGAFNIRKDSGCASRNTTENIDIVTKSDKPGIDIIIKPGTKNEVCHIPVIITKSGLTEMVYNDFFIGEDCDVTIIAGCGIHNCGDGESRHDGLHTFHIGKNARVTYVEKHYGEGDGNGKNVMNPQTVAYLDEGAFLKMDTSQIKGIDSTKRDTKIVCGKGAETVVTERLQTHGSQLAESDMEIVLDGENSKGRVISRSVAQDESKQVFYPRMTGNARCFGHVQCDSIIMDSAKISSIPAIVANCTEAELIHEAAIGKIAGDQLLKLETLGLTEQEAEERILKGFFGIMDFIDLHVHTTESDGTTSPEETVALAAEKGLRAIAITDHDTADGVAAAMEAGKKYGVEVVPGIEVSVDYKGYGVHILGYFIDRNSGAMRELLDWVVAERERRNGCIVELMRRDGIDVSLEQLRDKYPDSVIGRPHLAACLVERGLASSVQDGFDRYLSIGRKYYLKREYIPLEQAFRVISGAGGKAVFAHPLQYRFDENELRALTRTLRDAGAVGMECLYSGYTSEQTEYLTSLAAEHGMCVTGGSDFHGSRKAQISLGSGTGELRVPYSLLEKLKEA